MIAQGSKNDKQERMQSSHQGGPHRSVGVHIPNLRGHNEVWESISPTRGATQLYGFMSSYPQLKGPQKNCGFEICGQNPAFDMGLPKNSEPHHKYPKFLPNENHPKVLPKKPPNLTKAPPPFFFTKTNPLLAKDSPNLAKKNPTLTKKTHFFYLRP